MSRAGAKPLPQLSVRIDLDAEDRIGPGKIQLLAQIREHGSISAAGRAMDMSYKRAWDLVDEINHICGHAVVEPQAGGKNGGGAMLTPLGTALVARYRKIERDAARAVRKELMALKSDIGRSRKSKGCRPRPSSAAPSPRAPAGSGLRRAGSARPSGSRSGP
jgi:molybdate transport system regulatory protein